MEPIEHARHAETRQRAVDFNRNALAGEVVHHIERPKVAAVD
jgi:hypothetical protein